MKKIESIILTIFVFILSFIPLLWFHGDQILLGYDNVYPLNPVAFLKDRVFSWSYVQNFGYDQSGVQGSLIIHAIDSVPALIGLSPQISQKIVFTFWFFLLLFSSYIFIVRLEKAGLVRSAYLRYFFPVLYSINFYVLQAWWVAERTKFSLLVASPLILSIILPMVHSSFTKKTIIKNALICSFILTLFNGGGWAGLSLYGGLLAIVMVFYFYSLFILFLLNRKKQIVYLHIFCLLFLVSFILFNAYTFLPFILTTAKEYHSFLANAGGITGLIGWTRYLTENTSIINLLRLQGIPDWYNNGTNHPYSQLYFNNPVLIFFSFLFPLLIFLSFLNKKRKDAEVILFFLFLLMVSLILTAGSHKPFGFLFELMMEKIPGFIFFRSSIFKFGYAYWLSAAILIGIFMSETMEWLLYKIRNSTAVFFTPFFLFAFFLSFILLYHFPYLTGDFFRTHSKDFSSRVSVPQYVYDFSHWWRLKETKEKILLLPRLNENWVFEQYTWGYLSLFPILGNLANKGIVQNSDLISSGENSLVLELYETINKQDFGKMDKISSTLGIRYFLVRKDFSFNIPDQEAENPNIIEKYLINNPHLYRVQSFDKWIVYGYQEDKPFIRSTSSAIISNDINKSLDFSKDSSLLVLSPDIQLLSYSDSFSDSILYPECLSCIAEKSEVSITIPKPKILINSQFYEVVQLKERLEASSKLSLEESIFKLVGGSLKLAGQIQELLIRDKPESVIELAADEYRNLLNSIQAKLPELFLKTQNPYSTSIIIQQYLAAQNQFLNELIVKENRKSVELSIEKILHSIQVVDEGLKQFYSQNDFNTRKIYKITIPWSGEYSVKLHRNTLGALSSYDISKMKIVFDNTINLLALDETERYIDFGKIVMSQGVHEFALYLLSQEDLKSSPRVDRIAGKTCLYSFIKNFSPQKAYSVRFSVVNNFDPNFMFFVDNGQNFSPNLLVYFPFSGEQVRQGRYVLSSDTVGFNNRWNSLRVAFCAPGLTEEIYKKNVKEYQVAELTSPMLELHKIGRLAFASAPQVKYEILNQDRYRVLVTKAQNAFYLILGQRFSPGWQASVGDHIIGNNFQNIWYIEKKGDFVVDVYYKPQNYFFIGIIVSVMAISASLFILWMLNKS